MKLENKIEEYTEEEINSYLDEITPESMKYAHGYDSPEDMQMYLDIYREIPEELTSNRDFILKALDRNPEIMMEVDEKFCDDKEIVLASLNYNSGHNLRFASDRLCDDEEVAIVALENSTGTVYNNIYEFDSWDNDAVGYVSERLLADKKIAKIAVENSDNAYEYLSEELRADKEIAKMALRNNIYLIRYLPKPLLYDKQFLLDIFNEGYDPYIYISDPKADEEYCPEDFGYNTVIEYLPEELAKDRDIVLSIVKTDFFSAFHIADEFRNDPAIMQYLDEYDID